MKKFPQHIFIVWKIANKSKFDLSVLCPENIKPDSIFSCKLPQMKIEQVPSYLELTRLNTPSTLRRGSISMSDRGSELTPKLSPEKVNPVREAWNKVNQGRIVPIDERRTTEMLIQRGIPPIAGGADAEGATASPETSVDTPADRILRGINPDDFSDDSLKRVAEQVQELVDNKEAFSAQIERLLDKARDFRLSGADKDQYERLSHALREANLQTKKGERFIPAEDIKAVTYRLKGG